MQYLAFIIGIFLTVFFVWMTRKKDLFEKYNKYMIAIAVSLLIALSLEVFTFNFVSFERNNELQYAISFDTNTRQPSHEGNREISVNPSEIANLNIISNEEALTYEAEINMNSKLKDLDVAVDSNAHRVDYNLYYKDEATQSGYRKIDSNDLVLVKGVSSTGHVKTHFAGITSSIKLVFKTKKENPISKINVKINQPAAFDFNFFRFILVWTIALFAFIFSFTKYSTTMKKAILVSVMALQCFFIIFLSLATNADFGVDGKYKGEDFYQSMDPYQELTLALSQGKVDLNGVNTYDKNAEQQNIEALEKLDNTYEWEQRNGLSYKWDRAFYNGKYYCYFGIVPVLFVYLPIYMLTGCMVNTKILSLLLVLFAALAMAKLVLTIAKKWKKPINMWVTLGTIISFVNASMVISCINGSKFYEIASVSALVCALFGIDFILNAFTDKGIRKKSLLCGALLMALSVGCRPNYIFASLIVVPIVLNELAEKGGYIKSKNIKERFVNYVKGIFDKDNISAIVTFIVPYIIVGVGLMYYNYIRFGSITEFGAKYQLTVYDTSYYHVTDFGKIPIMLARAIFMVPTISSVFPYVNTVNESSNYVGYFYGMSYLGILSSPIMWLIFLVPWSIKRGINSIGHKGFVLSSLIVAIMMGYFTTAIGGTSLRYSVDFVWMFFIPVIYVIFTMYIKAKERGLEKYAIIGLGVLMIFTIIINSLVCISPSWSSLSQSVPEVFYRLEEMVVFWK